LEQVLVLIINCSTALKLQIAAHFTGAVRTWLRGLSWWMVLKVPWRALLLSLPADQKASWVALAAVARVSSAACWRPGHARQPRAAESFFVSYTYLFELCAYELLTHLSI
jgi:hypothetical protein